MRGALALIAGLLAFAPTTLAQDDPFGDVPDIVELRSYLDQDVYTPGSSARVAIEMRIDSRVHVNSQAPVTEFQYPTSLKWESIAEGLQLSAIEWPKPHMMSFDFTEGEEIDVWEGKVRAFLSVKIPESAEPGSALRVRGEFKAQGCTDTVCYAPQTDAVKFTVRIAEADEEPEHINESKFSAVVADGGDEPRDGDAEEGPLAVAVLGDTSPDGPELAEDCEAVTAGQDFDRPLPLLYLMAFGIGLLMTLTPCVLPLVPITIGYFSRQNQSGGRPVGLATVYVLGLALVYSALGTVAGLTGDLFGNALQNPYVLVGIAIILVGLSLSMFGLWNMQLPAWMTGKMGGARAGYAGALMMGGAMGLIAAPCVGPGVVGLLTYVGKLGADPEVGSGLAALIGGTLFFCLALGLGAPFFLVGIGAATINPGQWMESIKKVLGFLILGVALYFVGPALPANIAPAVVTAGMALLALAAGVYLLLPMASAGSPRLTMPFRVLGALAIVGGLAYGVNGLRPAPEHDKFFQPYTAERLAAARDVGKPVLIDFWATWCPKCLQLDAQTFSKPEVQAALGDYIVLKADMSKDDDPLVQALREEYAVTGLPAILFIDPTGEEVNNLRLNGFEPPDEFIHRVQCAEAVPIAAR